MLHIILMCISCFMFFANDLLLVYFICILDSGNDVKQNANLSDFLKFKMGCKAAETIYNITMHLAQEWLQPYSAVVIEEILQWRQEP